MAAVESKNPVMLEEVLKCVRDPLSLPAEEVRHNVRQMLPGLKGRPISYILSHPQPDTCLLAPKLVMMSSGEATHECSGV